MMTLIAGNWKMNGHIADLEQIRAIAAGLDASSATDTLICPPALILNAACQAVAGTSLQIGAQDCHPEAAGAHTGDVSAPMVADAGGSAVIVGHSERRLDHRERDADVLAKAKAVLEAGLLAIICVGETEHQRNAGEALDVISDQLAGSVPGEHPNNIAIAYEPVWAIGTGRTASVDDIAAMHDHIRNWLVSKFGEAGHRVRILYGGSVKPANAAEILSVSDVNGALVGGASLKADDFLAIVNAARPAQAV